MSSVPTLKPLTFLAVAAVLLAGMLATAAEPSDASDPEDYEDMGVLWSYRVGMTFTGGSATSVTWDFGDGSEPVSGYSVDHTYSEPGVYFVKQTATNDKGESTAWYRVDVRGFPTLTFESNGGSAVEAVTMSNYGVVAEPPEAPVKEGFLFDGWYLDPDLTERMDWGRGITAPLTLYAKWTEVASPIVRHGVTFDLGGGTEPSVVYVVDGETVDAPEIPERDGYVFSGWLLDGEPFDFGTPVTEDVVLKASWERIVHTVSFDVGDGSVPMDPVSVADGDDYVLPSYEGTWEGHSFEGWEIEGEIHSVGETISVDGDITAIAVWEALSLTVTFEGDGVDIDPRTVAYGGTVDEPEAPVREGFSFAGWFLGDSEYDFSSAVTADVVLTARWDALTFTVSFTGEGVDIEPQTIAYGGTVDEPSAPARTGYVFAGWFLGDSEYDFSSAVTADVVLIAHWDRLYLTVSFDSAGGSTVPSQSVAYGDKATEPKGPTRSGYSFEGWLLDGKEFDFDTPVLSDVSLVASWDRVSSPGPSVTYRTVTFDPANGEGVFTKSVVSGARVSVPEAPVREGYSFAGWYLGDSEYDFSSPVKGDLVLIAGWEPKTLTVAFDDGQGNVIEVDVAYGDAVDAPESPSRDGFSFTGWYLGGSEYDFGSPVTGDIVLVAGWEPMTLIVAFDDGQGNVTEVDVAYGDAVEVPDSPSRDGFSFAGWYLGDSEYDFDAPVTADIVLTAHWSEEGSGLSIVLLVILAVIVLVLAIALRRRVYE